MRSAMRLLFVWALLCLLFSAQSVLAATPRQTVEVSLNQILDIIKSPGYANPSERAGLRKKIAQYVRVNFDFQEFSSRTVGAGWRNFSPQQKNDFADAFADLLINTYVNKIDGYNGEQIAFTGERLSPKGDRAEIQTVISMKNGKKIPVSYRLLPKGSDWKVYDVLIENISLVKNYRTQFQDLLRSSDPDQLIVRLREKANEVQKSDAKK